MLLDSIIYVHNSHHERRQPLGQRVKFRQYTPRPNKVQISEYRDSPHATLKRIAQLVNDSQDNATYCYDVRRFALWVLQQHGSGFDLSNDEKIAAVYYWMVSNASYVNDPAFNELIHRADVLLDEYDKNGIVTGDCDDFTILACSLLLAVGVPCKARMIKVAGQDGQMNWAHIYPMGLGSNGQWIAIDATEKDRFLGWQPPEGNNPSYRKDWDFA